MMGDDNLIFGSTVGYRVFDKFKASFVFAIEVSKGEDVLTVDNATEVGDTILCDIGILQGDISPKGRDYDVDLLNMDYGIIVIVDIGANLANESVVHGGKVIKLVELVITQCYNDLLVILGCPIPERMRLVVVVAEIANVTCQYKDVATDIHGAFLLEDSPVIGKLQM